MLALELGSGARLLVLSLVSVFDLEEIIPGLSTRELEINMSLFTRIAIGCLFFSLPGFSEPRTLQGR